MGKLFRVWHKPQVPCASFYISVRGPAEAKLVLSALARYDVFQLTYGIKGDYCNAQGLEVNNYKGEWEEWTHARTGKDIHGR